MERSLMFIFWTRIDIERDFEEEEEEGGEEGVARGGEGQDLILLRDPDQDL
jgi:hypothetical protein